MYPETEMYAIDRLQERTENYKPTVTDRNSVAKAVFTGKKANETPIAEENVAIKMCKAGKNYQL